MSLTAVAFNCTLKADPETPSSTDAMIAVLRKAFSRHDVEISEVIRVAALNVKPGVTSDEGADDDWPALRARIMEADILIFGSPIWLGQLSSVGKRVLERLDAFLGETDQRERMPSFGKVAVAAIVGNEDGAHQVTAQLFQALNDVGFTIPANSACYWVGEAMQSTNFQDLEEIPEKVKQTAAMLASNAAHLAGLLKAAAYPGIGNAD